MFFCQNKTISKILVLTTIDTWENFFLLIYWREFYLFIYLFTYLFIYLLIYLFIYLFVCLSIFCLFIYNHIYCCSTMLAVTNKNQRQ